MLRTPWSSSPGARLSDRELLEPDGVDTLAGLAHLDHPVAGLDPSRQDLLQRQAALQEQARLAPADPPPFQILTPDGLDDAAPGEEVLPSGEPILRGFAALPQPDEGDVFLDYEGHPFWKADVGLFFLFGLIERDAGQWVYRAFWAHDRTEEAAAVVGLVDHLRARLESFPSMHVYHYNHTERSALKGLTEAHGIVEQEVEALIASGLFVDLYPIVTGALQVGVESYGLKHIERLTGYQRSHDIDRGAGAVIEYEHWMRDGDGTRLQRIARYNEDDVRATLAVRDWLVDHRPAGMPWRPAVLDVEPDDPELDARIEALHAYGPGTVEHLMGDLLGYWRRERRVVAADTLRLSMADEHDQLESPAAIARLTFTGLHDRFNAKNGKKLAKPAALFTFPPQPVDPDIRQGAKLIVARTEHEWSFFDVDAIDPDAGTLTVLANEDLGAGSPPPTCLVHWPNFNEGAKLTALSDLADRMLAGDATAVGHAILRRDPTRFTPGHGPADGVFVGDCAQVCAWAPHLDASYVPVQGPPGTGKTYTGAHVIHTLVKQGKRVGITAMSHHAIDNLTQEVVKRFAEAGDDLRAVRKAPAGPVAGVDLHQRQRSVCHRALRRRRRDCLAVRQPSDARQPRRRADRRRGRPTRPGRHPRGLHLGHERDPARRPAAAAPGGAGQPPRPLRGQRPRAPARRRRTHLPTRSRGPARRDLAHAPRRLRLHLRGHVRRQAHQPPLLRGANHHRRAPGCAGSAPTTPGAAPNPPKKPPSWPPRSRGCWAPTGPIRTAPPAPSPPRTSSSSPPTTTSAGSSPASCKPRLRPLESKSARSTSSKAGKRRSSCSP